ncbi:hypothetical protein ACWGDX_25610 [Streptomyces sp. NPDC055025]
MSNWISVVVILGLIAVGFAVIHLLNGQHRERIATYGFGRSLWNPQKRAAPPAEEPLAPPPAAAPAPAPERPEQHERHERHERPERATHRDAGRHWPNGLSDLISGRAHRRRKAAR